MLQKTPVTYKVSVFFMATGAMGGHPCPHTTPVCPCRRNRHPNIRAAL